MSNALSGRAAAKARRQAQQQGKGGIVKQAAPAAPVAPRSKPEPAPIASSQPSNPRRQVAAAPASQPASAVGREAAKSRRQQQKNGKVATQASTTQSHPRARRKPQAPVVEPRQASVETQSPAVTAEPTRRAETRSGRATVKTNDRVKQPAGRLQSQAYRKAQAQGKAGQEAFKNRGNSGSAVKAKLANPEASTREIARQVRADRCSRGKTCAPANSAQKARQTRSRSQAVPSKVGETETLSGQRVSGTVVGQGEKGMTGAETGACQLVSGTEYLGTEEFSACTTQPAAAPAKVTMTQTTRGQSISGTEVGRAEKMTGNEQGTCSSITGTEYLPADQSQMYCGTDVQPTAPAMGFSIMSQPAQARENRITEGGGSRSAQSTTIKPSNPAPQKVVPSQTAMGSMTTGTQVGRLEPVTGSEKGACKVVTGTGYQSAEEADALCGMPAVETAQKVTASGTFGGQVITGDRSGGSSKMTGAEAGACEAVTGTPYVGVEHAASCSAPAQQAMQQRQRQGANPTISGVQPGLEGITGAQKGACQLVSGTHYLGNDQTALMCEPTNAATPGESDFPMMMNQQPTAQAQPAPQAMTTPEEVVAEAKTSKITGDGWDRGTKVTGTEGPWAASRNASIKGTTANAPMGASQFRPNSMPEVPVSKITGSSGNTDTGAKVTLSGGARA